MRDFARVTFRTRGDRGKVCGGPVKIGPQIEEADRRGIEYRSFNRLRDDVRNAARELPLLFRGQRAQPQGTESSAVSTSPRVPAAIFAVIVPP
ncbi:MAG: hypothetical protein RIS70_2532 [Planctomycetota bacterium]|jgi:hypothetical protein